MADLIQTLQEAGLTGNEARVYYELLRRGSIDANTLSKKLSMDRTMAYQILNHLIEKGMVNYITKSKKKFFEASEPENLLNPLKKREALIKDLIPELKQVEIVKESVQDVKIYEGKEGLRTVMNLALKEKELFSFGATGRAFDALYEMPRIATKVSKSHLDVKIIGDEELKNSAVTQFKKFNFRFLNFKNEATTSIFGNYVSIHIMRDKPFIILIHNKWVAESYKNNFTVLWNVAKEVSFKN